MKRATLDEFSRQAQSFVKASQDERVIVTQNGKPVALVIGLENKDEEDWQLEISSELWRLIEQRRKQPTTPLEDLEADLFAR
jgi:prevent-host-death family protein